MKTTIQITGPIEVAPAIGVTIQMALTIFGYLTKLDVDGKVTEATRTPYHKDDAPDVEVVVRSSPQEGSEGP